MEFFCNIPVADQRHWKDLLSGGLRGRRRTAIAPQVDSQLKMLYFRYLKGLRLAEPFVPSTSELGVLTSDEWKQRGFDFASMGNHSCC